MNRRLLSSVVAFVAAVIVAQSVSAQSGDIPRTEHGVPDFQGTFTYRTLTPLNRPPELADNATLTAADAAEWPPFWHRR